VRGVKGKVVPISNVFTRKIDRNKGDVNALVFERTRIHSKGGIQNESREDNKMVPWETRYAGLREEKEN